MAPYAVAHFKLGLQLAGRDLPEEQRANWAYDFATNERLGIYLTNTLEEAHEHTGLPLFTHFLSDESQAANSIKRDMPIMVVMGNPPYSGHSANTGKWINDLLRGKDVESGNPTGNYFEMDGKPLGERNPKWLNDDYVKFIRFAQWRIERSGAGILAFISNNGYLDNPTFRGMRQSLMQTFTDIDILNLHGNSKKKETAPDGSPDENVFDIQQGVCIGIFVKEPGKPTPGKVSYADLWGLRESKDKQSGKYPWLFTNDVTSTEWNRLAPQSPFYLFVPQNVDLFSEYENSWKATDIYPTHGWGIATRKDYLLVDFSHDVMVSRFRDIRSLSPEAAIVKYSIKESPHWSFIEAKKKLTDNPEEKVRQVLFRPFDIRFVYYEKFMIERGDHRFDLMANMFQPNISLISVRRSEGSGIPQHFFCTDQISVLHSTSAKEGNFVFPLYLYPNTDPRKQTLFDTDAAETAAVRDPNAPGGRRPNLNPAFIADLEQRLGMTFVPDGKGNLGMGLGDASGDAGGTGSEGAIRTAAVSAAPSPSNDEIKTRDRGRLPHWEIENAVYFVTFRLADSLITNVLRAIDEERTHIIRKAREEGSELTRNEQDKLAQLTTEKIERYLDAGAGEGYLAKPEIAEMVANTLRYFDGKRYRLFAWCVMPNHVHVVCRLFPGQNLADTLHSWKSYSAKQVNKILGRDGTVWQREYYDHLIRDEGEFGRIIEYVAGNPVEAGLEGWQWVEVYDVDLDSVEDAAETAAIPKLNVPPASSLASNMPEQHAAETAAVQGGTFGPEDVFNYMYAYMYALFHSPTYRSRYTEFLKIDFPRLPLTSDPALFRTLCGLGEQLVGLHLMESRPPTQVSFPVRGSNKVEKVQYTAPTATEPGRVHINKTQYFDNVPPEAWEFHIGGYQVAEKWLKDRKGRTLTLADMQHYQGIIAALLETGRIMGEIDEAIPGWPLL